MSRQCGSHGRGPELPAHVILGIFREWVHGLDTGNLLDRLTTDDILYDREINKTTPVGVGGLKRHTHDLLYETYRWTCREVF